MNEATRAKRRNLSAAAIDYNRGFPWASEEARKRHLRDAAKKWGVTQKAILQRVSEGA